LTLREFLLFETIWNVHGGTIMNTLLALSLAFLLGKSQAKAQDGQITDKPIEAMKERIRDRRVYSRAEFQSLVLGKTEEQVVQLLGKPDHVWGMHGLCIGVCIDADFMYYPIRMKEPGTEEREVIGCVVISDWTGLCHIVSFLTKQNGHCQELPASANQ
jgi:hypothetical protein